MNASDSIPIVLAARGALYRRLQALFGNEPLPEILAPIASDAFFEIAETFSTLVGHLDEDMQLHLKTLRAAQGLFDPSDPQEVENLRTVYCELFVGPGHPFAPPWESMYRDSDRVLFQASTLDVRKAYIEQGLVPLRYPRVADDHVALELDFMGHLAQRMIESSNFVGQDAFKEAVDASERFLDEHLLAWIPAWCTSLNEAPNAHLYREAAHVLETFIQQDRLALRRISAKTEQDKHARFSTMGSS